MRAVASAFEISAKILREHVDTPQHALQKIRTRIVTIKHEPEYHLGNSYLRELVLALMAAEDIIETIFINRS